MLAFKRPFHINLLVEDKRYFRLVLLGCWFLIFLGIWTRFLRNRVWDDAYMFVRYADNLLREGRICWNPGGAATYGLTSLLFLLIIIIPLRFFSSLNPTGVVLLGSLLSGAGFIILFLVFLERYLKVGILVRRFLILSTSLIFLASVNSWAAHLVSGMDTSFAFLYLTVYLFDSKRFEQDPSIANAFWMGLCGGLAYWARPDLLIYSLVVPLALVFRGKKGEQRKRGGLVFGITVLLVLLQIGISYWFLHSPLPLSFYVKGLPYYSRFFYERYKGIAGQELTYFVETYQYLFLIVGILAVVNLKGWLRRFSAVEIGLLIGTGLFLAYYRFFAVHVSYWFARFYYPVFPAFLFLALQSLAYLVDLVSPELQEKLKEFPKPLWLILLLVFLLPVGTSIHRFSNDIYSELSGGNYGVWDSMRLFSGGNSPYWFALEQFSQLPDDLVIATTEVGLLGVFNPEKKIIDLAGLNDTDFAHHRFSPQRLFLKDRPDLIYLPLSDYLNLNNQIIGHPVFKRNYDYFPWDVLKTSLGIAFRKDSEYYQEMRMVVGRESNKCLP